MGSWYWCVPLEEWQCVGLLLGINHLKNKLVTMKLYQTKTEHPLNLTPQKWVLTVQYRAPTGDCCCFLVLYIKKKKELNSN